MAQEHQNNIRGNASAQVEELTRRLNETENTLRRTSKELEQFAYIASHDLKAPLRNIDSLARWVIEDTEGILPPDARRNLDLLCGRVAALETLLDDILVYSRAGRIVDAPVKVDVGETLARLIQVHVPASFTARVAANMPVIFSPPTPLEQVFASLLSNAVRHHDRGGGVIEIGVREAGDFFEFSVCDDGPGIPPEFHERAFQMFQTLQSRDIVPGSGLGLAIVRKLVEWQGARVWIVSDAGQRGTAVHFLWRRNLQQNQG